MFKIKKTLEVAVAHRLDLPYESKCSKFHGHNLIITIYCQADELNENGMVIDFTEIKNLVHSVIDHSSLSDVDCPMCGCRVVESPVELFESTPTAERLAEWICMQIKSCYRVDVQESTGNVATYEES
jgi:6-pyruvoyltetrahydropterin/6-carboxytetrahydropterin synthase